MDMYLNGCSLPTTAWRGSNLRCIWKITALQAAQRNCSGILSETR